MSKVLLVYCNSFMDNLIPVGVSILSAYLKKGGHEVKLFDTTFYRTSTITGDEARVNSLQIKNATLNITPRDTLVKDFAKTVDDFKPDIVGLSVVESTVHIYQVLLSILKGYLNYKGVIITGGIYPTTSPEHALMTNNMVCVGEGEETLLELANRIDAKQDYSDIKNLWIKKEDKIIKNPIRPLIDLESLPFQDWSIYEKERFQKPMGGKIWISGSIELSRGCAFRCLAKNTKITTIDGIKSIQDIKVGDVIKGYDFKTKKISNTTIKKIHKQINDVYKITLEDGTKIDITGNHPIYTKRGWIEIKDLTKNDEVFKVG